MTYQQSVGSTASGHGVIMLLSDGCIADMNMLVNENVVRNISFIVGHDEHQKIISSTDSVFGSVKGNYHLQKPLVKVSTLPL